MLTVPADPVTIGGADELKLRQDEANAVIQRFLQTVPPAGAAGTTTTEPPGATRLRVLNGSPTKGEAALA